MNSQADLLGKIIDALPVVTTSPFAFIAYVVLVAALIYIFIAQYRLRTIARVIEALPLKERGPTLRKEYNTSPARGLTAEQWIRARRHQLLFFAFLAVILCVLVVVILAFQQATKQATETNRTQALVATWESTARELRQKISKLEDEVDESGDRNVEFMRMLITSLNAVRTKLAIPDAAVAEYARVSESISQQIGGPDSVLSEDNVKKAKIALARGLVGMAKRLFLEAASNNKYEATTALVAASKLAEQEGQFLEAYTHVEDALKISPSDMEALRTAQRITLFLGKYTESLSYLDRIEQAHRLSNDLDENMVLRITAARGDIMLWTSNFTTAESLYKTVLSRWTEIDVFYATVLNNLGSTYHNWGRYPEAAKRLEEALDVFVMELGGSHVNVARTLNNIAYLNVLRHRLSEVENNLREAQRIIANAHGPHHLEMIPPLNNLGRYYTVVEDFGGAERVLNEAMQIGLQSYDGKHPASARTHDLLAELRLATGDLAEACRHAKVAKQTKEALFEPSNPDLAYSRTLLGTCLLKQREFADANRELDAAESALVASLGFDNARIADILERRGDYFAKVEQLESARGRFQHAFSIRAKYLGDGHPATVRVREKVNDFRFGRSKVRCSPCVSMTRVASHGLGWAILTH